MLQFQVMLSRVCVLLFGRVCVMLRSLFLYHLRLQCVFMCSCPCLCLRLCLSCARLQFQSERGFVYVLVYVSVVASLRLFPFRVQCSRLLPPLFRYMLVVPLFVYDPGSVSMCGGVFVSVSIYVSVCLCVLLSFSLSSIVCVTLGLWFGAHVYSFVCFSVSVRF